MVDPGQGEVVSEPGRWEQQESGHLSCLPASGMTLHRCLPFSGPLSPAVNQGMKLLQLENVVLGPSSSTDKPPLARLLPSVENSVCACVCVCVVGGLNSRVLAVLCWLDPLDHLPLCWLQAWEDFLSSYSYAEELIPTCHSWFRQITVFLGQKFKND